MFGVCETLVVAIGRSGKTNLPAQIGLVFGSQLDCYASNETEI